MKKLMIASIVAIATLMSCGKPESNNVAPQQKVVKPTPVATLTTNKNIDSTLTMDVYYTSANTEAYDYDVAYLTINDTASINVPIQHQGPNSTFLYTIRYPKYIGTSYTLTLVRWPAMDTIAVSSGN